MTESTMYWITRLDQIYSFCNGLGTLLAILAVLGVITLTIFKIIKEVNREFNRGNDLDRDFKTASSAISALKFPTIGCIIGAIFMSFVTVFIPTTKEMTAIKVIPQIATQENCQKLQEMSKDLLDITAKWLEDVKNAKK